MFCSSLCAGTTMESFMIKYSTRQLAPVPDGAAHRRNRDLKTGSNRRKSLSPRQDNRRTIVGPYDERIGIGETVQRLYGRQ